MIVWLEFELAYKSVQHISHYNTESPLTNYMFDTYDVVKNECIYIYKRWKNKKHWI